MEFFPACLREGSPAHLMSALSKSFLGGLELSLPSVTLGPREELPYLVMDALELSFGGSRWKVHVVRKCK